MIAIRKRYTALAMGTFTDLGGENSAVLAYLREYDGEVLLCVHNLSRYPQPAALDLADRFLGQVPVELIGETVFPAVGQHPYILTLPAYASFWFRITPAVDRRATGPAAVMPTAGPTTSASPRTAKDTSTKAS